MASYHFTLKNSSGTNAEAHMRADYICREGKYALNDKAEELVHKEHGNMPSWAKNNPNEFWKASELYERANGTKFREVEFALPNELTSEQQKELVKEFVSKHFGTDFVYTYALHSKSAALAKGVENPHVHIMFCERQLDEFERSKEDFFKRANPDHPEKGGCKKAARWNGNDRKGYLLYMREDCANLQNRYLDREGFTERVDHRTKAVQHQEALKAGDLDKAQLLESPAESHLGPKRASRVARELSNLTATAMNRQERDEIREKYWESRKDMQDELYQLRQIRSWKRAVNDLQNLDGKRGEIREHNASQISEKVYWFAKKSELRSRQAALENERRFCLKTKEKLEKLLKDEIKDKDKDKDKLIDEVKKTDKEKELFREKLLTDDRWIKLSERFKKVTHERAEIKKLQAKLETKTLSEADLKEIKTIGQNLAVVEAEKRVQCAVSLPFSNLAIKNMTARRVTDIDKEIKELSKSSKRINQKLRSEIQARMLAENRVSKGLIKSIARDEKPYKKARSQYRKQEKLFSAVDKPSPSDKGQIDLYQKEKERLTKWKKELNEMAASISARREGWKVQKEKPENKERIEKLVEKYIERNVTVKDEVSKLNEKIELLAAEKSEWKRIEYSLLRRRHRQPAMLLKRAEMVNDKLQNALRKLQNDRRSGGRLGARLSFDDDEQESSKGIER